MTWVDYAVIAVLALSVLVGLVRGFVREVLGLVGWLVALFFAARFAPEVALWLPQDLMTPFFRQLLAAIGIFVVVSLIAGVLAWLIAKAAHSVGLGLIDRVLGSIFGLARGLLIVIICAVLAGLSPLRQERGWQDAVLRGPLETAAIALKPYLPQAIAEKLRF